MSNNRAVCIEQQRSLFTFKSSLDVGYLWLPHNSRYSSEPDVANTLQMPDPVTHWSICQAERKIHKNVINSEYERNNIFLSCRNLIQAASMLRQAIHFFSYVNTREARTSQLINFLFMNKPHRMASFHFRWTRFYLSKNVCFNWPFSLASNYSLDSMKVFAYFRGFDLNPVRTL